MARTPLSVCIIAKNEADRIQRCIDAVNSITDDIVVVDSGSTDDTVAIAKASGARTFYNAWVGFGPQKRFAEDCAAHDWVLNIDADEVIEPDLESEIKALLSSKPALSAYRFRQVTVYPGRDRPRLWADAHNYVRLYDRRVVRFCDSLTHDTVDTRGVEVGQLNGSALHFSWRTLDHVKAKLDSYTDLQAKEMNRSRLAMRLRQPIEYPFLFFRYYVLRRHFTGGLYGLKTAHVIARGRAARVSKFLRRRGTPR
jgi:glycosyltransferase involved in cell wall biosynthesis